MNVMLPAGSPRPNGVTAIGRSFCDIVGCYNAAMTAVELTALMENRAKVEIEATAVIPEYAV